MTDNLLRKRYIEAGLIRPNTKELEPIQLNPGAIVFRVQPDFFNRLCEASDRALERSRCWH